MHVRSCLCTCVWRCKDDIKLLPVRSPSYVESGPLTVAHHSLVWLASVLLGFLSFLLCSGTAAGLPLLGGCT